jgi:hypothetical protein
VRYVSSLLHLTPSDCTVSEDAGIELRTVATLALTSRRFNHARLVLIYNSARSHPHSEDIIHGSARSHSRAKHLLCIV